MREKAEKETEERQGGEMSGERAQEVEREVEYEFCEASRATTKPGACTYRGQTPGSFSAVTVKEITVSANSTELSRVSHVARVGATNAKKSMLGVQISR